MIEPTEEDIGRKVVYTGNRYPGGELEEGVITKIRESCIFVRYGPSIHSQATYREDLEWTNLAPSPLPSPPKDAGNGK